MGGSEFSVGVGAWQVTLRVSEDGEILTVSALETQSAFSFRKRFNIQKARLRAIESPRTKKHSSSQRKKQQQQQQHTTSSSPATQLRTSSPSKPSVVAAVATPPQQPESNAGGVSVEEREPPVPNHTHVPTPIPSRRTLTQEDKDRARRLCFTEASQPPLSPGASPLTSPVNNSSSNNTHKTQLQQLHQLQQQQQQPTPTPSAPQPQQVSLIPTPTTTFALPGSPYPARRRIDTLFSPRSLIYNSPLSDISSAALTTPSPSLSPPPSYTSARLYDALTTHTPLSHNSNNSSNNNTTTTATTLGFFSLAQELQVHICSFLTPIHLATLARVCKRFRLLARDDGLWRSLFSTYFGGSKKRARTWRQESMHVMTRVSRHARKCQEETLLWGAKHGHTRLVERLVATHRLDVNTIKRDKSSASPLHLACHEGHLATVKLLVGTHKANVNARTNYGRTPLERAAKNGHAKIVEYLLGYHADVNAAPVGGETPLLVASLNNHVDIVKLLLGHGADPSLASCSGFTALRVATLQGHTDIVNLLVHVQQQQQQQQVAGSNTNVAGQQAQQLIAQQQHQYQQAQQQPFRRAGPALDYYLDF
eukprot:TRINITY_DN659_c0_g2_i1.p1 TRINITY_DN659_c0_g2~~TRINITY_DN659_c0_g2_i1.p1  ORF type:complete len:592 (+),score=188.72 TRINITY_DN659_c0_g2_i1:1216-2991(+)